MTAIGERQRAVHGMSVIVIDTKEHAEEAAAYPLPPLPGVTPLTVEIREVYASA